MHDFSDAERDRVLSLEGDAVLGSVGAYRIEGPSIRLFERSRGRLLYHPRPAPPAAARGAAGRMPRRSSRETCVRPRSSDHALALAADPPALARGLRDRRQLRGDRRRARCDAGVLRPHPRGRVRRRQRHRAAQGDRLRPLRHPRRCARSYRRLQHADGGRDRSTGARSSGTNTDHDGFLANLDAALPGWDEGAERAIVLGAGGAARGVLSCARNARYPRNSHPQSHARKRRWRWPTSCPARSCGGSLDDFADLADEADLVVNTTTVGMDGHAVRPRWRSSICPRRALVTDIVYTPLETPLLAAAAKLEPQDCRWPRHAAPPGGAGVRIVVRRSSRGHGRAAGQDRGDPLMQKLGLTGSIATGKSTVLEMFRAGASRSSRPTRRCMRSTRARRCPWSNDFSPELATTGRSTAPPWPNASRASPAG